MYQILPCALCCLLLKLFSTFIAPIEQLNRGIPMIASAKSTRLRTLSIAIASLLALPFTAGAADQALTDEVVIKTRAGSSAAAIATSYGLTQLDQFGKRPIYRFRVAPGTTVESAVNALRADSRVAFAEPNYEHQSPEARLSVVWEIGGNAGTYAAQWAPQAMNLPQAHAHMSAVRPGNAPGAGIRVAMLDSGVDATHPLLSSRLIAGKDFVDGDDDPTQGAAPARGYAHGTHVAGLIALSAPGAQIMPLRVLDTSGKGNVWVLAEAIMHAVDPDQNSITPDGAHVINLSLGTTQPTRLLDIAVELATCSDEDGDEPDDDYSDAGFDDDEVRCNLYAGAVVVSGAGNGGSDTEQQYPAAERAEGAISVAATTSAGTLAGFSNRGSWVEIAAPGEQITSALPGGQWGVWSGTSMATPLVAGTAALIRAANPDWKPVDVTKRMMDRSSSTCGTSIRRIDSWAAVADFTPLDAACPSGH
jgi:subtilisin family serine protease